MKENSFIANCLSLAKGILHDRTLRRKMVNQLLFFLLLLVVVGHWVIDDWLLEGVLRFVLFWGLVTVYVIIILLMAAYDLLKVMRDE